MNNNSGLYQRGYQGGNGYQQQPQAYNQGPPQQGYNQGAPQQQYNQGPQKNNYFNQQQQHQPQQQQQRQPYAKGNNY